MPLPALAQLGIAVAPSIIGGLFGMKGANDANAANRRIAAENIKYQREFAQHGLSWRVEDAKRSGLHPLAALGASTMSYRPQAVGGHQSKWSKMGQSLSRMNLLDVAMRVEEVKNAKLRNKLLEIQVSGKKNPVVVDANRVDFGGQAEGVVNGEGISIVPKEVQRSDRLGVETGMNPMTQEAVSEYGEVFQARSKAMEEAMESAPWFSKMKEAIIDAARHGRRYFESMPRNNERFWREIVRIRPRKKIPVGYEYRWHVFKQVPIIMKKDRPQGRLFTGIPKSWYDPGNLPGVPKRMGSVKEYRDVNYPKAKPWRLRKSH